MTISDQINEADVKPSNAYCITKVFNDVCHLHNLTNPSFIADILKSKIQIFGQLPRSREPSQILPPSK